MKYTVKHGLGDTDRVKWALDKAFKANTDRLAAYSPKMKWTGPREATVTFTVMAKTLAAGFTIADDDVVVEGKVPFVFKHFEERIKKVVGQHLEEWFAKARAGET